MAKPATVRQAVVGIADEWGCWDRGWESPSRQNIESKAAASEPVVGEIGSLTNRHKVLDELGAAVRRSLSGLVHNRREAWPITQFRPGIIRIPILEQSQLHWPTEERPCRGPRCSDAEFHHVNNTRRKLMTDDERNHEALFATRFG